MKVWVLWYTYLDGSGAHIKRAYFDETCAKEGYALSVQGLHARALEWHLSEVETFGSDNVCLP